MRALSFWRPWPWVIFRGGKDIENRGHEITYRGEFLIHAAKKFDHDAVPFIERTVKAAGIKPPLMLPSAHPEGALVGVATIVECWELRLVASTSPWAFGPYCCVLTAVREFAEPIPWKGKQGWFHVPDDIVRAALT